MNLRSSEELSRILSSCLTPVSPLIRPASLHALCLRTAAVYATAALYEFHDKQTNRIHQGNGIGVGASAHGAQMIAHVGGLGNNVAPVAGGGGMGVLHGVLDNPSDQIHVDESMWDAVFPLLDAHFLQLIPTHLYEQFLDNVLSSLEVAGHYDANGKALMQYIILFFPKSSMRRFKAQRCYKDRVLMPTICCLHRCTNIEELYLEKADSPAITTYLLAHILKFLNHLKVLALPKQCDDDVASCVGINCPKLESIVLTGTNVSNVGLSWLVCCRQLHSVIIPGFFQGITPKGVALLLNGLPGLRHVVYDVMSDVLTYVDFNTSEAILPKFGLRTVLFHSMELLGSNHLELVTKLCPNVEWLSLDSALFYNLEGLGHLPRLRLLRLNYKGRSIDDTVMEFFTINGTNLTTLHLFDVKDLTLDDFCLTVGKCPQLETFVLYECSIAPDWRGVPHFNHIGPSRRNSSNSYFQPAFDHGRHHFSFGRCRQVISHSVDCLQIFGLQLPGECPTLLVELICMFRDLLVLEMDRCDLDVAQIKAIILAQPSLQILRCAHWTHATEANVASLAPCLPTCRLQVNKQTFTYFEEETNLKRTMAAQLLSEYAGFSPLLSHDKCLHC